MTKQLRTVGCVDPLASLTGRENSELGQTMTWKVDARFRKSIRGHRSDFSQVLMGLRIFCILSVFTYLVYAFIRMARRSIPAVFLDHVS